jgi:transcription antitermination factor NusG
MPENTPKWYAVTVQHQHERRIETFLRSKDLETLVPVYRSRRQWSDRTTEIDAPLFAGYVFCRFPLRERVRVLNTPGVRRLVGFAGKPEPIDDRELTWIQAAASARLPIGPWPFLKPGDRVRVEWGPLRGVEGTLLRERDRLRLVIGIELLQRALAVEVEPNMVAPLALVRGKGASQCG